MQKRNLLNEIKGHKLQSSSRNKKIIIYSSIWLFSLGLFLLFMLLLPEVVVHLIGAIIVKGEIPILAVYIFLNPRFLTQEKSGTLDSQKYRNITFKTWHLVTKIFSVFVFFVGIYINIPLVKDISGLITGEQIMVSKTSIIDADTPGPMPQTWFLIQNILLKGENNSFYTLYFSRNYLSEGMTYNLKVLKNSNVIIYEKLTS